MKLSKSKAKYIAKAEKVLGKYNIATPEETIDKIIKWVYNDYRIKERKVIANEKIIK